ncbi:DUF3592 domain-containing protein [Streptomyces sp. NPDC042319]|uniref:DUF3592 domain-containing protein n=1 Tax=Streptomyces sp. NPDC042319 TaxID=3154332 RepID=UPI0033F5039E
MLWLAVLFLLMGPVVIGFGIREAALQRRLRHEGIRTEGLVVRHRRKSSSEGGHTTFAVVNFVDAQGGPHEFQAQSSGVKGLPVGGQAPVLYLPGAPKTARLDISSKRVGHLVASSVGGIAFMAIAIWMLSTGR